MLVLTRKANQSIIIGDDIEVTVVEVRGEQVRLGITAPREIPIYRREIYEEMLHGAPKIGAAPHNGSSHTPPFAQPGALTTVGDR
jgi:carbon storage regulator